MLLAPEGSSKHPTSEPEPKTEPESGKYIFYSDFFHTRILPVKYNDCHITNTIIHFNLQNLKLRANHLKKNQVNVCFYRELIKIIKTIANKPQISMKQINNITTGNSKV